MAHSPRAWLLSLALLCSLLIGANSIRIFPWTSAARRGELARQQLNDWFLGEYDNSDQASRDLSKGRPTAKDGGHELVAARIVQHPLEENVLIASYHFSNLTQTPFRFRYYQILPDDSGRFAALMKLYKPSTQAEQALLAAGHNPPHAPLSEFEYIKGCDVGWSRANWAQAALRRGGHLRGVLVQGSAQLPSQRDPNLLITVKDDLHLFKRRLWVNDRVYLPDGSLLIGNIFNIPYKFRQVVSR
ncbi:hypothetical protein B484DRAFT_445959 [Ochromonadaceae sp. CCMP2298]|nr:hypothetical protein B484DRAFT_445959 [Ochromonadaceae sp. CCMP2298]|mmetsp:Transcript_31897/g.68780  ORF Transcript_31897/g.68780 Transcript_31897/m.68780 type:complete len:244 (-) Transcript_31897:89-820(-)